jgi:hypothetical protein
MPFPVMTKYDLIFALANEPKLGLVSVLEGDRRDLLNKKIAADLEDDDEITVIVLSTCDRYEAVKTIGGTRQD